MIENKTFKLIWLAATILLLAAGSLLLAWALLSYPVAKSLVDRLAQDGSLESFTPAGFQSVRWVAGLLGLALLVGGVYSLVARDSSQRALTSLANRFARAGRRVAAEVRELLAGLRRAFNDPIAVCGLLAITVTAIAIRLAFIQQPMRYDEAYTYYAFASQGVRVITSDYHLPNNHVLHSLFVYLTTAWLGNALWSIRLTAFIAGVLMVPAAYLAGTALYDRYTALFGAALVASASTLVEYSTNARGYTLMTLVWLLLIALAAFLKQHPNRMGWALFALLAAVGLYTVPTMLFPLGIVLGWLGLSWLGKDTSQQYGRGFLFYLTAAVAGAFVLTGLAYLPIVSSSGLGVFTSTRFVEALEQQVFIESLWARLGNTWRDWTINLPLWASLILAAGFVLSIIFHRRLSAQRIHYVFPTILWCSLLLLIQRVAPWPRVWLFMAPLFFIWAAAGTFGLLRSLRLVSGELASRWRIGLASGAVALALGLAFGVYQAQSPLHSTDTGHYPSAEKTALYLKEQLKAGDVVVAVLPSNYPLRYYFEIHGVPTHSLYRPKLHRDGLDRAWVVVNLGFGQTLESVLQKSELQELLDRDRAILMHADPGSEVYILEK